MEQKKLSEISILKFTLSTIYSHFYIYAQIVVFAFGIMKIAPFIKEYIESTEFIPSGHLDMLGLITFKYIFKFWFWGACVVVAARIVQTGKAFYVSDFLRSLKYAPAFIIIQTVFVLPMILFTGLQSYLEPYIKYSYNNFWGIISFHFILPWLYPAILFIVGLWQLYGQLAIPAFVLEKQGIWKSITLSLHKTHKLAWKIIGLNLTWMLFLLVCLAGAMIGIFVGVYLIMGTNTGDMLWNFMVNKQVDDGTFFPLEYPLMALAYVYLYTQSRKNTDQ